MGQWLLGAAFGICAAFAILTGFVVAIVITPVLVVAHAVISRGAGRPDRRTRFFRARPDRSPEFAPVIEGEFKVIDEGVPERRSQRERSAPAEPTIHRWPPAHTV